MILKRISISTGSCFQKFSHCCKTGPKFSQVFLFASFGSHLTIKEVCCTSFGVRKTFPSQAHLSLIISTIFAKIKIAPKQPNLYFSISVLEHLNNSDMSSIYWWWNEVSISTGSCFLKFSHFCKNRPKISHIFFFSSFGSLFPMKVMCCASFGVRTTFPSQTHIFLKISAIFAKIALKQPNFHFSILVLEHFNKSDMLRIYWWWNKVTISTGSCFLKFSLFLQK